MLNLTPEEKRTALFIIGLGLSGIILNNLMKINADFQGVIRLEACAGKLDLNKASLEELAGAKNVSLLLARRILEYRERNGDFSDLKQLKEIKGVKEKRYEQLKQVFFIERI